MDQLLHVFSKRGIDIQDVGAVSMPASEFFLSKDHSHDSITDLFSIVAETVGTGRGFSRSKNYQTSML